MSVQKLKQKFYRPDQYNNDGPFRQLIYEAVDSNSRVMDAGAGGGELFSYELKDRVREIAGVDLDPRVETNPQLHRGIVSSLTDIPIEDNYFDVVFSRSVLEHIEKPADFLNEMYRILKPGGAFIFKTPNRWHYFCIVAQFTPYSFHAWYNRMRGREEEDTFPTYYRMNSRSALRRQFRDAGFVEEKIVMRECCPNYLTFSVPSFLLGVAYERLVNATQLLAGFRINILGKFAKKA